VYNATRSDERVCTTSYNAVCRAVGCRRTSFRARESIPDVVAVVCALAVAPVVVSEVVAAGVATIVGSDVAVAVGGSGRETRGC
jgi:hypothetical protein